MTAIDILTAVLVLAGSTLALTHAQLNALALGLPWQRVGEAGIITVL